MAGKGNIFRYIDDEESQNDFFVSLLAWSLDDGPDVLNAIHDDIQFSEHAEIVATQRSGLPISPPDTEGNRILDWVVRDDDKLVGYESKTGGSFPSTTQLRGERRKLDANADGREVLLFTFTDHTQQPETVDSTAANWISWYEVAERVLGLNTEDKSIRLIQEMFRENGYEGFTGFTDFSRENRWLTKHDAEFVTLAYDVNRHLEGIEIYTRGNTHLWHSTSLNLDKLRRKDWSSMNQAYLTIHFHPEDQPACVENYYRITLFLPALENDLRVYMDISPSRRDSLRRFVRENAPALSTIVEERGMHLRTSWNSFNTPSREFMDYEVAEDVTNVLVEKAGHENWKRLLFGWEISVDQSANAIVREVTGRIEELYELFFEGSGPIPVDELPRW